MQMLDVHNDLGFHALVFAREPIEAVKLADAHRAAGFGYGNGRMSAMQRFLPLAGASRDHLRAALDLEKAGIGHLQPDGSWQILPPGERSARAVRPQPMTMHAYADDDGDEYVIFAPDEDRAFAIYTAYLDNTQALPSLWLAQTYDYWQLSGLVRHEPQACARGVEGVGLYSDAGWVILPIDYARLGLEAP